MILKGSNFQLFNYEPHLMVRVLKIEPFHKPAISKFAEGYYKNKSNDKVFGSFGSYIYLLLKD